MVSFADNIGFVHTVQVKKPTQATIKKALYKHVASYIRAFPSGRGYMIRFVQKKNVPAFKQILTKSGINVTYVGEVAK